MVTGVANPKTNGVLDLLVVRSKTGLTRPLLYKTLPTMKNTEDVLISSDCQPATTTSCKKF